MDFQDTSNDPTLIVPKVFNDTPDKARALEYTRGLYDQTMCSQKIVDVRVAMAKVEALNDIGLLYRPYADRLLYDFSQHLHGLVEMHRHEAPRGRPRKYPSPEEQTKVKTVYVYCDSAERRAPVFKDSQIVATLSVTLSDDRYRYKHLPRSPRSPQ